MFFKDMDEYIEKLDLYYKEAGAGNAKAMVELGKECNWQKAFRMMVYWLYKAFERGEHYAAGMIIRYYYRCENYKEALHWIDSALKVDERNVDALYFKGLLYLYGYEVEKDESMAIDYLTQAAEQNSNSAILTMACIYRDGLGVPVDNNKAAEWVKKLDDVWDYGLGYTCSILNPKPEEWIKDFVYKITLEYQMYSSDVTDEYELQHPDDLPDFHTRPEKISLDMKIIEDVGFDSLDAIEWIMAIEEALNTEIMDAEAEKLVTLQDMYDLLLEKQQKGVINFNIENIHHDVYLDHVYYEYDEEV